MKYITTEGMLPVSIFIIFMIFVILTIIFGLFIQTELFLFTGLISLIFLSVLMHNLSELRYKKIFKENVENNND